MLKILCSYLQLRFERRLALREVKLREQAVVATLRLVSEIGTQRDHEGLFRKMKENLPGFFGFQSVGVLIYDFNSILCIIHNFLIIANWLFTDPDTIREIRISTPEMENLDRSNTSQQ